MKRTLLTLCLVFGVTVGQVSKLPPHAARAETPAAA